jgi:crotonobetaine/carnitine-CoA ligase
MQPPAAETMAELVAKWAEIWPDRDVLTFEGAGIRPDEIRTYSELWSNANRLAASLLSNGMRRGDRFAVLLRNHPEFVELMIAGSITGCILVPIDARTRGPKLAYSLNDSGCRGAVCGDYALAHLEEIRSDLPRLEWIWVVDGQEGSANPGASDVASAIEMKTLLEEPQTWVDWRDTKAEDPFQIMYTSGTTGDPKGVVLFNRRYGRGGPAVDWYGVTRDHRPYTGLSLTHGNALGMTLMPALALGQRAVFSRRFTKSRLWDVVRQYNCTSFNIIGGMATAIYSMPEKIDDADNPVEYVLSSGMPANIWEAFEKRFGLGILEFYGTMEGGNAFNPIGVGPVGSFGKAAPNLESMIVDSEDNECPAGVPGELLLRPLAAEPPKVQYWNNPEASAKKTHGGWLRTGDVCHADENGWLFFDHRMGDGIRRNGDFINPGFVERVLAENELIDDVFVYGIPAASGAPGEKDVVAAIVVRDDMVFDPKALFAHCEKNLESNFVPSYVQVLKEIPKTASEKPQARFLIQALHEDDALVFAQSATESLSKIARLSLGSLSATKSASN